VLVSIAGADEITQWKRVPTVIRTGATSSQSAHPFGDWLYREAGCRNVTSIGNDYTFPHEAVGGALATFRQAGGKVAKAFWSPIGTADYGPILAGIPAATDCVMVAVAGTDRLRLLEQWFDFGYDRKHKIYGLYWLMSDVLPEASDRAVGLIGASLIWADGLETPEARAFVDAYAKKYRQMPSWFAEVTYATGLWARTAIDGIAGKVEDRGAFLAAMRRTKIRAPRGPVSLDAHDNPVENVYIQKVVKVKHPVLGDVKVSVPVKTYENVSQFWTWKPEEVLSRGPYQRQ
jgi:branched-chain amino acid transport system substrate-binding protein